MENVRAFAFAEGYAVTTKRSAGGNRLWLRCDRRGITAIPLASSQRAVDEAPAQGSSAAHLSCTLECKETGNER